MKFRQSLSLLCASSFLFKETLGSVPGAVRFKDMEMDVCYQILSTTHGTALTEEEASGSCHGGLPMYGRDPSVAHEFKFVSKLCTRGGKCGDNNDNSIVSIESCQSPQKYLRHCNYDMWSGVYGTGPDYDFTWKLNEGADRYSFRMRSTSHSPNDIEVLPDRNDRVTMVESDLHEEWYLIRGGGGVSGDPHFRTWSGEKYDFHGVCDLVLLTNPNFEEELGMDIHVRSKKMNQRFSYVSSASVRIGEDILEVTGKEFWINGKKGTAEGKQDEIELARYLVEILELNEKSHQFTINLGNNEKIVIKTWNAMVRVGIENASDKNFGASSGLMGVFITGTKLARDGITKIDDINDFGREWQVLPTEPKIFHGISDVPVSPIQCIIPNAKDMRRRLNEFSLTMEEAKVACTHADSVDFDLCVFDVMVSNDKDMSGVY